ncbi:hypothetical protein BKI52_15695 [marine bacterium AO1-C]|nr:hypothetical protein BKI52_15695 [marine bacterium AO1-C]
MTQEAHIPHLTTISRFYDQLRIGQPQGDDFAMMRIEDQPDSKRIEMPLFRCNFYRVVFVSTQGVHWNLPDQVFSSSKNSLYFSYPGKLESWSISQKIYGYLVSFDQQFAYEDAQSQALDQTFPFFNFEGLAIIQLTDTEAALLKTTLEQMLIEVNQHAEDKEQMLRHLLFQYLIQIKRIYTQKIANLPPKAQQNTSIYNRFRQEVDQYFVDLANGEHKAQASVSLIAERVNLNSSYLNTVIKNLTGQTASSYIQDKTLLEAKSYLMHTSLQIAEIAFRLGFNNVSYFNRFFKRGTHHTPLDFRKSHQ